MTVLEDVKFKLAKFDAEFAEAQRDAKARLAGVRRVKLGDFNLREDLYEEMKSVFCDICHSPTLRRAFFYTHDWGHRSRRLLLILMSEMVYWEYGRSFWHKWYEILELEGKQSEYHRFTSQMIRGFEENDIPLIRSVSSQRERKEYVQTIIGESGFSRKLVQQAKNFVIWFFDNYSDLDPRTLDAESFGRILDQSHFIWNKDEIFELLRDMVGSVSRLLREIRKRSLTSADLRDTHMLSELENTLGFHPVRGIFGFRRSEDIQELLEQLSTRVKPDAFYAMLRRKTRTSRAKLWVITPQNQTIEARRAKDVPIMFGEYRLVRPRQSEIQVVPREALTLSDLVEMLHRPKRIFYQDKNYAWIHDDAPFEIYQGSTEPEQPRLYYLDGLSGYLWYGKQKIGMPLRAEQDGQVFSDLVPRRDVWLNPRLRLSYDATGLEVVIPSFVCYEPEFAGQTVRLELNSRPIEDTTYVIGRGGSLQFQATRVAKVHSEDRYLEVCLTTLSEGRVVSKNTVYRSLVQDFLFNRSNRELVQPGHKHYGGDHFVLFATSSALPETGDAIHIETLDHFGPFQVYHLRWVPDSSNPEPFDLKVGQRHWHFTYPIQVHANLICTPATDPFQPQEHNSAFDPADVKIRLHLQGSKSQVSEIWPKLSLILEKDGEFLTDLSLKELESLGMLTSDAAENEYALNVSVTLKYLIGQRLIDREIGTYRWTLMLRPHSLADLEPLSEMEFMLLPNLRVEGLDVPMVEDEESLITIFCDAPLLTDEDDRSTNILRLDCKPKAKFDTGTACMRARYIDRTIRLSYPPTKVTLQFLPRLFAIRLVCQGKVLSRPQLTCAEAKESYLAVLAPPNEPVEITGLDSAKQIIADSEGQGRYQVAQLLSGIRQERTQFDVIFGEFRKQFQIVWHPTLKFDRERCHFRTGSDKVGILVLYFSTEGPPDTKVSFGMGDNQFRSHGKQSFSLVDLSQGTIEFAVDLQQLHGASLLFCSASVRSNRLDSIQVSCGDLERADVQCQLAQQLRTKLRHANPKEMSELVGLLKNLGLQSLTQQALQQMYSLQYLDQVYQGFKQKRLNQGDIATYFRNFVPSLLPEIHQVPVAKLKKCCSLPVLNLQLACAEELLLRGDGVGVDEIVDLLAQGRVSWDKGIEILSKNKECASEVIRDIVQWDNLELKDDEYIKLMGRLSQAFHPPMARRARAAKDWKRAIALFHSRQVIDVEVTSTNSNGLLVPMGLIFGQVPIEELDTRRRGLGDGRKVIRRQISDMVNETIQVIIIDVNRYEGRLILSERQARQKLGDALLRELKEGDIRQGIVTNLRDFGAFVDLGGIDGLIRTSELSWNEIKHPSELLSVSEQVEVCILTIDRDQRQVNLSRKKLLPDPWSQKTAKYKIGQIVKGQVKQVTEFGVFVSIEAGIDGFVHISELSYEHIYNPRQMVEKGKELTLRVLRVDEEKHRLTLSLKQVGKDNLYWGHIRIKTD